MNRQQATEVAELNTHHVGRFAAVCKITAAKLLGPERYAAFERDRIRFVGPTPETVYPWNLVDYLDEGAKLA